jgi:hypothetical protein
MIKLEYTDIYGFEAAIRGMRNPMDSWYKSDSNYGCRLKKERDCVNWEQHEEGEITFCNECGWCDSLCDYTNPHNEHREYIIGNNDLDLMIRLIKGGTEHRKFLRMINVTVDITAPLYWWKEFDTYKVGTVANSCSTMHKIHEKPFTFGDFSIEHIGDVPNCNPMYFASFDGVLTALNEARRGYLATNDKNYWWQMIQLLPSSYNQKRTVQLNYEVLLTQYHQRKGHKLDEWHEYCKWIESLPYMAEFLQA